MFYSHSKQVLNDVSTIYFNYILHRLVSYVERIWQLQCQIMHENIDHDICHGLSTLILYNDLIILSVNRSCGAVPACSWCRLNLNLCNNLIILSVNRSCGAVPACSWCRLDGNNDRCYTKSQCPIITSPTPDTSGQGN